LIGSLLLLPGRLAWTTWASKTLPNAVEWIIVLMNSLLWGLVMGTVAAGLTRPKRAV
jgi:hypothetical protein